MAIRKIFTPFPYGVLAIACMVVGLSCSSDSSIGIPNAAEAQLPGVVNLTDDQTVTVRSIDEVIVDEPPTIGNVSESSATLLFDSSMPLVCAIVYGKTTEYGLIATDLDMAGGAHSEHRPFMPGLEPDTQYHYRVQGSAADGTIFVGEDGLFKTPAAQIRDELNVASLAAGARVSDVSSNFGGAANSQTWGADSAIDGSEASAWSSDGDGNDAFIEIEFAGVAILHTVEVWTRSMSNNTAQIFSFTLTTDSGEVLGPFELVDALQSHRFDVEAVTRSLRLDVVDSNGGNTGLIELAAYGTID